MNGYSHMLPEWFLLLWRPSTPLGSTASALGASWSSGVLCGQRSLLSLSSCLLLPLPVDGLSIAAGKVSIKGARERLEAFFELAALTLRDGPGAPPAGSDETATFPLLGLPRPNGLFLPLTGLTGCGGGSGDTSSTRSPTTHQSQGTFLLRLSAPVS